MKKSLPVSAPNPQGKATLPTLERLAAARPADTLPALSREQTHHAYFAASLVLSAKFNFEPRRGQPYFLYYKAPDWQLSLIDPAHDRRGTLGTFFARCTLGNDWLWHIHAEDQPAMDSAITEALLEHYSRMSRFLATHTRLEDQLPWYPSHLPFHHRVAARALALSLRPRIADGVLALPPEGAETVLRLAYASI